MIKGFGSNERDWSVHIPLIFICLWSSKAAAANNSIDIPVCSKASYYDGELEVLDEWKLEVRKEKMLSAGSAVDDRGRSEGFYRENPFDPGTLAISMVVYGIDVPWSIVNPVAKLIESPLPYYLEYDQPYFSIKHKAEIVYADDSLNGKVCYKNQSVCVWEFRFRSKGETEGWIVGAISDQVCYRFFPAGMLIPIEGKGGIAFKLELIHLRSGN